MNFYQIKIKKPFVVRTGIVKFLNMTYTESLLEILESVTNL